MTKPKQRLKILQFNTTDIGGGAEKVGRNLFQAYRQHGHDSWFAVGFKKSTDRNVFEIPNNQHRSIWTKFWRKIAIKFIRLTDGMRGSWRLYHFLTSIAEPKREIARFLGIEDFDFFGNRYILKLLPERPDLIHCNNLHGKYFNLRILPWLSRQFPVVVRLADMWLLTGHCAQSFDCKRWVNGCGQCPDLTIYPAVRRDATAYNWRRKLKIYAASSLYVTTPSQWLMKKVEQSMLAAAISEAKVIPTGVDLSIFHPGDKKAVRAALDIPQDAKVVLFTANSIRKNPWKDYETMRAVIALVAGRLIKEKIIFIALGENAPRERTERLEVRFVPYQKEPEVVARYYQAADIYIHMAKADTFPNTVLEALACGIPAVATAVGGIPEQLEDGTTGFLVPPKDVEIVAARLELLLSDVDLRHRFSLAAAETARQRFDLTQQVNSYLEWYYEILERWHKNAYGKGKPYGR